MAISRRLVTWAVVALAATQAVYWVIAAALLYMFRGLFVGENSPAAAVQTRNALLVFAWFVVNVVVIVFYVRRRGPGRWAMAGLQTGNFSYGLWLLITGLSSSCYLDNTLGLLAQPAVAATTLFLLYAEWRRARGARPRRILGVVVGVALIGLGVGSVLYGWRLGVMGIQAHQGTIVAVEQGTYGQTLTVDSLPMPIYLDVDFFVGLPTLHVGQRLELLTADSPRCGHGGPVVVEAGGATYIDQLQGGDVAGYTPETWATHEALRTGALVVGMILMAMGIVGLLWWTA